MERVQAPSDQAEETTRDAPARAYSDAVLSAAGNRAIACLAQTEPGRAALTRARSPRGRMLQRVGERKAGYAVAKDAPIASLELLKASFAEIRARRKKAKDEFERTKLKGLAGIADVKTRQNIVLTEYVEEIELEDWAEELRATEAFSEEKKDLVLDGETVKDKDGKVVATLTRDAAMFEEVPNPAGGDRKAYKKRVEPKHTYVADNRGVETRRYAFVEKSIFQMMEFRRALRLTGRYQRFHAEMGEAEKGANVLAIKSDLRRKIGLKETIKDLDEREAALVQLAVLHQWMGSGVQQRGLSLTSTPRPDAVFGNRGESFRTGDGVRITIDLAKVPAKVLLINQYASQGTKGKVNEWIGAKDDYNYWGSVVKNRELYLEWLEPAWVEAIDVHGVVLPPVPSGKSGEELVKWIGDQVGYVRYLEGYWNALDGKTTTATDAGYQVGTKAGSAYANGYAAGASQAKVTQPAARWNKMEQLFLDSDEALQRQEDYWLGWLHGVSGKPRGGHMPKPPAPAAAAAPKVPSWSSIVSKPAVTAAPQSGGKAPVNSNGGKKPAPATAGASGGTRKH